MEATKNDQPSTEASHPVVRVVYNGVEKEVDYNPHAAVQALLNHAVQAFGINQNPHIFALWTEDGREFTDLNQSAQDAGIKPGTRLILQPSAVRGGRR